MVYAYRCLILLCALFLSLSVIAETLPIKNSQQEGATRTNPAVKVAVLKYGTANWELQTMKRLGFDQSNGFELELLPMANVPGTQIALKSGDVDMIVSDWLWVSRQREQNDPLQMIPYSSSIGQLLVSKGSGIRNISQLKGRRIGVAGGPLSKGWVILQAYAQSQGIDLVKQSEPVFGAPPLLSHSLNKGDIDALVTFWHYGVRLQQQGATVLNDLQQMMAELGMQSQPPMLGYVFSEAWAEGAPSLVQGFATAVRETKQALANNPDNWLPLRSIMKAEEQGLFEALQAGYVEGIPAPLSDSQISDAHRFYSLLHELKLAKTWPDKLDEASFWR